MYICTYVYVCMYIYLHKAESMVGQRQGALDARSAALHATTAALHATTAALHATTAAVHARNAAPGAAIKVMVVVSMFKFEAKESKPFPPDPNGDLSMVLYCFA